MVKASDLPLSRTLEVGKLKVHALEGGLQWLDGGAMFGVVPRPLWEKKIPPDPRHRIPLALRCLLVETENNWIIIIVNLPIQISVVSIFYHQTTYFASKRIKVCKDIRTIFNLL